MAPRLRTALHELKALTSSADETVKTELCSRCTNAVESNDIARIGSLLWLNDGILSREKYTAPIAYCALCATIIRSRELAKRTGKNWDIISDAPAWPFEGFGTGMLIHENQHSRSTHQILEDTFEPKADSNTRAIDNLADPTLLKSWIMTCDADHGIRCNGDASTSTTIGTDINFIDVIQNCIVPGNLKVQYFALSYVWGAATQYKLLKSNSHALAIPGSLSQAPLPQTIQDSIALVASMNERYLWVDALCIVQDDDATKGVQIDQMASIYASALVTIVALSGQSASSGLPGVLSPRPRNHQALQIAPGIYLAPRPRYSDLFKLSVYNSRAWTYQERILSKRCLFFTEQQVYFRCSIQTFCEDRHGACTDTMRLQMNPFRDIGNISRSGPDRALYDGRVFSSYSSLVSDYTSKNMSYPSDILNAFTGISHTFSNKYQCSFWNGLPDSLSDLALLWTPVKSVARREITGVLPLCSASWAGWVGEVHYLDIMPDMIPRDWRKGIKSSVSSFITRENTLLFSSFIISGSNFSLVSNSRCIWNPLKFGPITSTISFLFDQQLRRCGILYGFEFSNATDPLAAFEFVLLSTSSHANTTNIYGPILNFQTADGERSPEGLFDKNLEDKKWCTLNVLLVEWKKGIAYRVGIGQICREVWDRSHPVQKDIFLG
jgi:Heterokaryon incompatibility protein (HET)